MFPAMRPYDTVPVLPYVVQCPPAFKKDPVKKVRLDLPEKITN